MREAFAAVAGLEDGELASTKSVRLLTDSRSGLQLLGRGPANQTMALAAEVWRLLSTLAENGTETVLPAGAAADPELSQLARQTGVPPEKLASVLDELLPPVAAASAEQMLAAFVMKR
ncbi:hypothetical protein FJT64_011909 [Amphibalanus amphitrite]|uniref:Uncharacterized protein n=1 Tax=Amphibalanus amphitrite TaxID=1232801 RepID=A0A6A4V852_AMPAM|nr:hypothetical protein FJT64_011909 [Amphibalanus amphitrite]